MFTHAAATVLAVTLTAFGFGGGHGHDPGHDRDHGHAAVAHARHAIAPFHRLAVAKRAGYGVLSDAAGIQCIDNPGVGGMGVHVVNGTLVGDGAVRASTPEALVYEPPGMAACDWSPPSTSSCRPTGTRRTAPRRRSSGRRSSSSPSATGTACRRSTSCTRGCSRATRSACSTTGTLA